MQIDLLTIFAPVISGLLVVSISAISTFVLKFSRSKTLGKFKSIVNEFVVEAEQFMHYSGEEKKNYVFVKCRTWLLSHNVKWINDEMISDSIETIVKITNQVNTKATKKGN